jgi:HJR/Mrr/RecB family endonuclease
MATEREVFEAKKLEAKYGVVGKVAARYRMAGYLIEVVSSSDDAPVNFIASKKGEKLAVKVAHRSGRLEKEVAERLAESAAETGARPVLVLYGSGPRVTSELLESIRAKNIGLRRVRT